VCRPGAAEGEACDEESRVCVATTFCEGGACVPRRAAGEPCQAEAQCVDRCDEDGGVCVAYAPCL
jgi:hypothetical protein